MAAAAESFALTRCFFPLAADEEADEASDDEEALRASAAAFQLMPLLLAVLVGRWPIVPLLVIGDELSSDSAVDSSSAPGSLFREEEER